MVWKFYICTTTGLFFCSFPLENCHLPQPLETSCLIGLSVQCIGPWLGQFITLILNPDFFFFHGNMPRNKSFLERLSDSVLQAGHECSFTSEQLPRDKIISKNKCPSVSKTCLISASSIPNLSIGSINSV